MTIKLNLIQDLCYLDLEQSQMSLEKAYLCALQVMAKRGPGFEVCLKCRYKAENLTAFLVESVGFSKEPDEQVRRAVENLEELKRPENPLFAIQKGEYSLCQLPYAPEPEDLFSALIRVIQKTEGTIYIRLIKESMLEVVVQTLEG
ncbi:MAG: hypothetical protein PHI83_02100 [Sphaerochaetaceae bacterium]|jgi:hypothetical protein|nr:hypothetical protein [Sphaerochaetaceae bacterium]